MIMVACPCSRSFLPSAYFHIVVCAFVQVLPDRQNFCMHQKQDHLSVSLSNFMLYPESFLLVFCTLADLTLKTSFKVTSGISSELSKSLMYQTY